MAEGGGVCEGGGGGDGGGGGGGGLEEGGEVEGREGWEGGGVSDGVGEVGLDEGFEGWGGLGGWEGERGVDWFWEGRDCGDWACWVRVAAVVAFYELVFEGGGGNEVVSRGSSEPEGVACLGFWWHEGTVGCLPETCTGEVRPNSLELLV